MSVQTISGFKKTLCTSADVFSLEVTICFVETASVKLCVTTMAVRAERMFDTQSLKLQSILIDTDVARKCVTCCQVDCATQLDLFLLNFCRR